MKINKNIIATKAPRHQKMQGIFGVICKHVSNHFHCQNKPLPHSNRDSPPERQPERFILVGFIRAGFYSLVLYQKRSG
jgi:hypothetical protein